MKSPKNPTATLSRYTTLPVLLDLLQRQALVLVPPNSWVDRNDREVMAEYKKRKKLSCLLAACFSQGDETIHHWTAFANGPAGCRIDFNPAGLLAAADSTPGCRWGVVQYRKIHSIPAGGVALDRMPFTKRWPYRCEEEFRILFESTTPSDRLLSERQLPIDLDQSIRSITIHQAIPPSVFETIKHLLGSKTAKRISRSTLLENQIWINKFKSL